MTKDEIIETNNKNNPVNREEYLLNLKKAFATISRKMKMGSQAIIYFKDSKLKCNLSIDLIREDYTRYMELISSFGTLKLDFTKNMIFLKKL